MRSRKRLICAALAVLLVFFAALAEESGAEPAATPTVAASVEPTSSPDEAPGEEPSAPPAAEPGADPAEGPTPEASEAPTPEATEVPAPEPTEEPTPEATEEPTPEPTGGPTPEATEEPAPEPTGEPTPEPTPALPEIVITTTATQGVVFQDDVYQAIENQPGSISFAWECPYECELFRIYVINEREEVVSALDQIETEYELSLDTLQAGRYLFAVEAIVSEEAVARGEYAFALSKGETSPDMPPDGPPDRQFPSGRPTGGFSKGGGRGGVAAEPEQGFHVTPGEALTSSHVSGTKDMRLYGAVELTLSGEPMTELVVGGAALDVVLDGGNAAFTAVLEEDGLRLVPEGDGDAWTLNGLTLKILSQSGVETLELSLNGSGIRLTTGQTPQGDVYARLRAEGYASSDYTYTVSEDGIRVSVEGREYRLDDSGALIPLEGDGHAETMDGAAAGAD